MLNLSGPPAPSSSSRRSIWYSAPAAWSYAVAATLCIGLAAYKAFTSGMLWLAVIQLALAVIPLIIMALTTRSREYDKALQRIMTVFVACSCLDLFRLR